ncbi:MAG: hypothetical protein R2712_04070 [Vicinamibacterales bacterium]
MLIPTVGLGPTDDDLTRKRWRRAWGSSSASDPAIVEAIRARFTARGLTMPEVNRRQAQVPDGATVSRTCAAARPA